MVAYATCNFRASSISGNRGNRPETPETVDFQFPETVRKPSETVETVIKSRVSPEIENAVLRFPAGN
jgi:hypothetical protein